MVRILAIIGLVGLFMATGIAVASPAERTRLPVQLQAPPESPSPDTVEVVEGDHLWKISARHLGSGVGNEQIAPYWREVVAVNTPRLRSGDPDLIYAGEIVELPATPERP